MTVTVNITAKLLVEGDASKGNSALLAFIKDIDQRIADWTFTLALADYFDKLRADHAKEATSYGDVNADEARALREVYP